MRGIEAGYDCVHPGAACGLRHVVEKKPRCPTIASQATSFAGDVAPECALELAHQCGVVGMHRPNVPPPQHAGAIDEEGGWNANREECGLHSLVRVEPERVRHAEVVGELADRVFLAARV